MKNILESGFVKEIKDITANMYRLGWDERHGGNISMLLDESEIAKYLFIDYVERVIPIEFDASELIGRYFIVTATGSFFRNIEQDPERNLGLIRIGSDGKTAELLWGFAGGGSFTSELPTHLMSHIERLKADPENRVVLHCHPTNTVAMTHIHEAEEKSFTRALWGMCSESIMIFPDGVGVLPWMLCGTTEIGRATAEKMKGFRIVVWWMHGVYGAGRSIDDAFGLIETVEKAAELFIKTEKHERVSVISDDQLREIAKAYNVNYREDFLGEEI